VGMNVPAEYTIYNDTSKPLINLLKALKRMSNKTIISRINAIINEFDFSRTRNHNFKYYGGDTNKGVSAYNREKFLLLRERFNTYPKKDNQYYILLYTLIPVGIVNYIPVQIITQFNLNLFLITIGVTTLLITLAFIVFYKGLKRYSSSNLMVARI
jgi:hypothetical protein